MGLAEIVRGAVALANNITAGLQVAVLHQAWDGTYDGDGNPVLAAAVSRQAIVEWKQRLVRSVTGQEAMSPCRVTFVEPLIATRYDQIKPPPATEYHSIVSQESVVDPGTSQPYYLVVDLG